MLVVVGECFCDCVGGAKDGHGGLVTNYSNIVLKASFEELAVFEGKAGGFCKVSTSS